MSLHSPQHQDDEQSFISRFMGDAESIANFPDEKQRAAVAYQKWKDHHSEKKLEGEISLVAEDESSGHWITSDGEHLFIHGGTIAKGPAHLVGKSVGDAHEWHAKQRDSEAKNSRRQVDYHMKRGEKDEAEKHAHIAKFHEDKAKELRGQAKEHQSNLAEPASKRYSAGARSAMAKIHNAESGAQSKPSPASEPAKNYKVGDKGFDSHKEAVAHADKVKQPVFGTRENRQVWEPAPPASAKKQREYEDRKSAYAAQQQQNADQSASRISPNVGKVANGQEQHEQGSAYHENGNPSDEGFFGHPKQLPAPTETAATSPDHAAEGAKHSKLAAAARKRGDQSGFEEHAAKAQEHFEAAKSGEKSPAPKSAETRVGGKITDDQLLTEAHSMMETHGIGGLLPIHELRDRVASKYGADAASHENLDPQIKKLRGDKLNTVGLHDHTTKSRENIAKSVQGYGGAAGETHFYVRDVKPPIANASAHTAAVEKHATANFPSRHEEAPLGGAGFSDRQKLSNFSPTVHSEQSADRAARLINPRAGFGANEDFYTSNDKDFASGQGENRGVKMEFDASKIHGAVNTNKPGWDHQYDQGRAEFLAEPSHAPQALSSLTIDHAIVSPRDAQTLSSHATRAGLTPTKNPDGTTTFSKQVQEKVPADHTANVEKHVTSNLVGGASTKNDFRNSAQFGADKKSYPPDVEHSLRQSVAAGHIEAILREQYPGDNPANDHKLININGKAIRDFRLTKKGRDALESGRKLSADWETVGYQFISLEAAELTGGTWKTINGARVYIKDGIAIAGPNHLVGKNETEVGNHGAAPAKRQGFHPIHRDAMGNYRGDNHEHAERLKSLKLAPGYTHVHLAEDPKAALQSVVKDSKGRDQYKYSAEHSGKASSAKWDRAKRFAQDAPAIKQKLDADTSEEGAALRLIHATGLRIGGTADTGAAEQAYGATTLESHHVSPNASGGATLKFVGKKGVSITHDVTDPAVAKEVLERAKSGGKLYNTTDAKTRDLLHQIAPGTDYKVKDFRTHAAAVTARNAMKSLPAPTDEKSLAAGQKKVAEAVAAKLGNTPAVAIKDYIPPETFAPWHAKVGNLQQAGLIQKFAKAKGITPDAAAPEWIGKHAASFRDDYKSRHAVTGKAGKLNEAAYLSSEQQYDDADRSEQVQDRSGDARDDRRDILRSASDAGGDRGSGSGSREDRPRRRIGFDAVALDAGDLTVAKEIPGALEGLPTFEEIPDEDKIEGEDEKGNPIFAKKRVPIQYYRKEVVRAAADGKKWTHRGLSQLHGEVTEFPLTIQDLDETVRNFHELDRAGIHPFIPDRHVDRQDAAANNGKIIALERKGNGLFAKMKVVGTKGNEKILNNDVSVHLVNGNSKLIVDAYGKPYKGWVLHHVALTPNPNQPHLQPFEKIAASAESPEQDVPVFRYSAISTAAPSRRRTKMTPQLAAQARQALGITASVEEEQFDDIVGQKAIALSADFATITHERDTLKVERDQIKQERDAAKADAEAKSLALSAEDPTKRDPMSISLITRAFRTDREQVIASGVVSEAGMKEIDAMMFGGDGKPTRTALALSAGSTDPLYSRLCEILRRNPGTKVQNGAPRDATAAIPALSAEDPKADAVQKDLLAEARKALGTKGAAA